MVIRMGDSFKGSLSSRYLYESRSQNKITEKKAIAHIVNFGFAKK